MEAPWSLGGDTHAVEVLGTRDLLLLDFVTIRSLYVCEDAHVPPQLNKEQLLLVNCF